MKDYYDVLEIAPSATAEKIKQQYRFLVHAYHPDKFPVPEQKARAEEKLKEINEAFEVLGNPLERARYDRERIGTGWNAASQPRRAETARPYQPPPRPKRPPRSRAELARTNEQLGTGSVLIYIVVTVVLFIALRALIHSLWMILFIFILAALISLPLIYKLDDYLRQK